MHEGLPFQVNIIGMQNILDKFEFQICKFQNLNFGKIRNCYAFVICSLVFSVIPNLEQSESHDSEEIP